MDNFPAELIVLFGSYVKGTWVEEGFSEERGTIFRSDFDILVIVKSERIKRALETWEVTKNEIRTNNAIETKPRIIAESVKTFNDQLRESRYFYSDVYTEGIQLFDSEKFKFRKPRKFFELEPKEKLSLAKEYYEDYFEKAEIKLNKYQFCIEKEYFKDAAFELHQATENLLNCINLTFTGYKPPTNGLLELKERAEEAVPELKNFFFEENKKCTCGKKQTPSIYRSQKGLENICTNCNPEARLFVLLAIAYLEARYYKNYKITAEELEKLYEIVLKLQKLIKEKCEREIERLK